MKTIISLLLCGGLIVSLVALVGCETDSSEQIALTITPNHASLRVGQSQEFVAGGFDDYTWSLSNPKIGVLSTKKGDRTVYTAVVAASNETQVLTVTAIATTSVISNRTSSVTAEALITNY